MMLSRFPLRMTSGSSQRASSIGPGPQGPGLAPPQSDVRPRSRSMLGSDAGLSTHSGPSSRRLPSSNSQPRVTHRHSSSNHEQISVPGTPQVFPPGPLTRPSSPSESSDLDESITLGIRRRRDSSNDIIQLTPRRTKCLKTHAQKLASDRGIPLQKLLAFIENGDLFIMLLELRAGQIEREEGTEANAIQELEKLISLKDFESALKSRLTACMLSPNLTAYVTDTQQHVMEFIQGHTELFKISEGLFDDNELRTQLGKLVTRLLATIRGQIKTALTTSIIKRLSIMDALKPLIHSGMEVDSSHWTRFAFLRRCLRIFLIGVHDHEKLSLQDLFSPYLIASLYPDLQQHIEITLKVDLVQLAQELQDGTAHASGSGNQNGTPSAHQGTNDTTHEDASQAKSAVDLGDKSVNLFVNAGVDTDVDGISDNYVDPGCSSSGFGLDGSEPKWNKQKFWNYIDAMLEQIRESARDVSDGSSAAYEDAYRKAMVEILQLDLQEFPGRRKFITLSKAAQPMWQETIQKKLLW
ncbi:uncharacterized protein EDB91DRAFT_1250852 [Suillus paluster]|uniref:uncharacterized protein n=1 Tax=Suillus paluster TaxID=48578 RepID=UPI001B85EB55|nr:uncharacterized protein EDB91DRAFT_1250852 [Suillus paluster]KAG1734733.1 hypothetical protein EDB91DRAFT_1250852 [Suillus paluster]